MVGEVAADAVDPVHRERAAAAHRDAWGRRRGNHVEVGHGAESRGRGRIAIIARPVAQRSSGRPALSPTRPPPSTTRAPWATRPPPSRPRPTTRPPPPHATPTTPPTPPTPTSPSHPAHPH